MLQGLLSFVFAFSAILLILLILIQKGKGSIGIGTMGGGSQMLFGGSGGQDVFQKATWVLGAILIFGSLGLAILKSKKQSTPYTTNSSVPMPEKQEQLPEQNTEVE